MTRHFRHGPQLLESQGAMTATLVRPPSTSITVPWTKAAWQRNSDRPACVSRDIPRRYPHSQSRRVRQRAHALVRVSIAPLVEL